MRPKKGRCELLEGGTGGVPARVCLGMHTPKKSQHGECRRARVAAPSQAQQAAETMHAIWRRVRRPFRRPCCQRCEWETFDVNQAGCLKCGASHFCHGNAVDNRCPLVLCDDRTRVCNITGFVLPEVRHAVSEHSENVMFVDKPVPVAHDIEPEVRSVVGALLLGERARRYRQHENARQYARLGQHMQKRMRLFKLTYPGRVPGVCEMLAGAMAQERYWRFMEEASEDLVVHCTQNITGCLQVLRGVGVRISQGHRLRDMVCGMLYMLKNGLVFRDRILLSAIPEVEKCLPHENKIETHFGISSKVICMTENEVKLVFRETYQT